MATLAPARSPEGGSTADSGNTLAAQTGASLGDLMARMGHDSSAAALKARASRCWSKQSALTATPLSSLGYGHAGGTQRHGLFDSRYAPPLVDATTVVAVAGLIATAATAIGVPLLQHRMSKAERLHDMRIAAYADAMAYVQHVEVHIDYQLEHPDLRTTPKPIEVAHPGVTSARLRLLAPPAVVKRWKELIDAREALLWNTAEDGPVNDRGDYHLTADQPDVIRVRAASEALTESLRLDARR